MVENELIANIGQFVIGSKPAILTCLGLGSCVGVVIYQENFDVAGLMHVMLPICPDDKENESNIFKYANKGIPLMIDELCSKGCNKNSLKAKIAGGAHMFASNVGMLDIGKRNVEAILQVLKEYNVALVSQEVGGNIGRTMRFNTSNYEVIIKTKDYVKTI